MDQLPALIWGKALFDVKMGIEVAGMHASIGAPATSDGHALLTQQQREAGFQSLLHRRMFRLNLPTEKRRTVVCQMDKVAHKLIFQGAKVQKIGKGYCPSLFSHFRYRSVFINTFLFGVSLFYIFAAVFGVMPLGQQQHRKTNRKPYGV